MIVALFAGPGGACAGIEAATGIKPIGIEHEATAIATRDAAGHVTIDADLATMSPCELDADVDGLWASPPCPAFSDAGKREGTDDLDHLCWLAARPHTWDVRHIIGDWHHPDSQLIVNTFRWIAHHRPAWVALEQVRAVLPVWQALQHGLEVFGYSSWAGVLNAADHGVPQTRRRAFFAAALGRNVQPPEPTHTLDPQPALFGPELEPWITMAEALGWSGRVGFPRKDDTGTSPDGYRERDWFSTDGPAPVVTEKGRSWQLRPGGQGYDDANRRTYNADEEPAPTIAVGNDQAGWQWELNTGRDWKPGGTRADAQTIPGDNPAPTVSAVDGQWQWHRPATTIQGDSRVWPPGHKINQDDRDRLGDEADERYGDRAGTEAIRCEPWELGVLQGFPADYPWQGGRTKVFGQVGNAVPPPVAEAIVRELTR